MKGKRLSVSAIENGTVIDHISAGQALKIIRLLKLSKHEKRVSIGLNLPSMAHGTKDLIKVEDWELSPEEANEVAILAPDVTIAIIRDFQVSRKFKVALPEVVEDIVVCPNPLCVTNHETAISRFRIRQLFHGPRLICHYCRQTFNLEQITDYRT